MRRRATPGTSVVVKVGSSSLTKAGGGLDEALVARAVDQVVAVREGGHPVVLVTSGAVAAGVPALGLGERPVDVPGLQAAAAVGQGRLIESYNREFAARGLVVAQVLLTRDVLANRNQYLHARAALERLLGLGVVPVVNENDTVVVDELGLGDNDRLAAIVSHLVGAGMLVILTDTPGLYSGDPRLGDEAELLSAVLHTDEILDELYRSHAPGAFGSGGVATKVSAARMAAWSGIPTVIADAARPGAAAEAAAGNDVGTWIEPHESKLTARKLWIAFGLRTEGRVAVDDGAARAVVDGGGSLLAAGVVEVDGRFGPGAAIEVTSDAGVIGKGLTRIGSEEIATLRGKHTSIAGGAVIHRDDLVVLV